VTTSSSQTTPAMRPCAKCHGVDEACSLCHGVGFVTLSANTAWLLDQGRSLEASGDELPDTEPEGK
jgi:hypothetical protein